SNVLLKIQSLIDDDSRRFEQRFRIACRECLHCPLENLARNESEDIANIFVNDLLSAERNDLVQQRLCIAHASFGSLDDIAQRAIVDLHTFAVCDLPQVGMDFSRRNCSEHELLAA